MLFFIFVILQAFPFLFPFFLLYIFILINIFMSFISRSSRHEGLADSTAALQEVPVEAVFVERSPKGMTEATPFVSSDTGVVLIKGGTVVNCDSMAVADILVEDGKITAVGEDLEIPEDATVINATNKYIIPGGIDTNTHLYQGLDENTPVKDDFETGTRAALAGGTTTVVDLVIPQGGQNMLEAFNNWRRVGEEKSCCDFALTVAVPCVTEETKKEMVKLTRDHGVSSFKMFMSYKDTLMLENSELIEAFKHVKELGCIAKVHAENGSIISENQKNLLAHGVHGPEGHLLAQPVEVEEEAVLRACSLAKQVNVPLYICSPTSREAVDIIQELKSEGLVVYGEPSCAALCVDGSHYYNKCWSHAASFITSPPIRDDPGNKDGLVAALVEGILDIVGSGHCTYDMSSRAQGLNNFTAIPHGVNGVEERMSVVYERGVVEGKMPMTRFVEVTSSNAAKLHGLYPRKGCLAVGSDGDIVIWSPQSPHTIHSKTHHQAAAFNIFQGEKMSGAAEYVLCQGRVVVEDYQLKNISGHGNYIGAQTFPAICYDKIQEIDNRNKPTPVERLDILTNDEHENEHVNNFFGLTTPRGQRQHEVYNKQLGIYQRSLSVHGVRNQQDSSFSLSGPQREHHGERGVAQRKPSVRVSAPPGGQGGAFW